MSRRSSSPESAVIWWTTTSGAAMPTALPTASASSPSAIAGLGAEPADQLGLFRRPGHPHHVVSLRDQRRDELLAEGPVAPATKTFIVASFRGRFPFRLDSRAAGDSFNPRRSCVPAHAGRDQTRRKCPVLSSSSRTLTTRPAFRAGRTPASGRACRAGPGDVAAGELILVQLSRSVDQLVSGDGQAHRSPRS